VYLRDGYLCGLNVLTAEETAAYRAHFDACAAQLKGPLGARYMHKTHLMWTWMDALVHHPKLLAAVTEILGPDVLCWTTNLFVKAPHSPDFVSWHQDSHYWNLEPEEVLTAWIALSPSTPESGCLRVLPGTHREAERTHEDHFAADNMLSRGQAIGGVDDRDAIDVVLAPGQMSLHHIRLIHASNPNTTDEPRIGIAIRYTSARVVPIGRKESALRVAGTEPVRHFLPERRPTADNTLRGRKAHNRAIRRQLRNNYRPLAHAPLRQRMRLSFGRVASAGVLDGLYLLLLAQTLLFWRQR